MPGVTTAYQTGIHSARPANGAGCVLYDCTTHGLIYRDDGASWTTFATLGGSPSGSITASGYTQNTGKLLGRTTGSAGAIEEIATAGSLSFAAGTLTGTGLADQGVITYLDGTGAAAPGTPASGKARLYVKTDGRFYSKDAAGVEYGPFDAGGGSASPTLYIDTLGMSVLEEFDTNMGAWTAGGSPSASSVVTSEPYDATAIDLTFPTAGDCYYRAIDSGDFEYYLVVCGFTNGAASPPTAVGGMMGLMIVDNSGNGSATIIYNDTQAYRMVVAANAYSSTGAALSTVPTAIATGYVAVLQIKKVGSTITHGISFNGGFSYLTSTTTNTTATRIQIGRLFSSGGTNPSMRCGKLYLVS